MDKERELTLILTPKICPNCDELLDGNGLIYWCGSGHIFDADTLHNDEMGLEFSDREKKVIAEISARQEIRPAKVIKQALAAYQLIVLGSHELREINPTLKLPSDEFFADLRKRGK
jgi:hypothetical protein